MAEELNKLSSMSMKQEEFPGENSCAEPLSRPAAWQLPIA